LRYLWHDDPAALNRVKASIHQLRKLFGADGDRFVTASGGYSLQVAQGELDASVFEALVAEAAAIRDRERVVALLSQAVSLWRGPAFEEFADTEWAVGEASRLDTLRLRALEDLVSAELDVGLHAKAVDRLERLVNEHPLREHFWGQLMVALYRCGRQAEALRAFQRVRGVLADELGINPSVALIELERRVLDQDRTLEWGSGPGDTTGFEVHGTDGADKIDGPVGTVTFLFTDIEDSTRLSAEHPALMPDVLARHDEIVTSVVNRHGGFIFSWAGDGMAAAFQRAATALDAAVETQRQLRQERWPAPLTLGVRMALHTGETQERAGNYFGPPVNRAARLLTLATPDVMGHHPQAELVSIGEHQLPGVFGAMLVFRVAAVGLAAVDGAGPPPAGSSLPPAVRVIRDPDGTGGRQQRDPLGEELPDDTTDALPAVLARARESSPLSGGERSATS
jgi:class 3 adenylate cyclase